MTGSLVGGAVGDALGGPIEFDSLARIRQRYGLLGVSDYPALNRLGLAEITDDTQMTLFTAEGLILANESGYDVLDMVQQAYLRWLSTQQRTTPRPPEDAWKGWLWSVPELYKRQAPGNTCLSALQSGRQGSIAHPINNSKGCGGVMRAAPAGWTGQPGAFALGCETAALTHGHPSGYLSAGCLAQIVAEILAGSQLLEAVEKTIDVLKTWPGHQECLAALQSAVDLAASGVPPSAEQVEQLGAGWVGEEALAIGVYCALMFPHDFRQGVLLAVNHSGDSDSTGSIAGNILGACLGMEMIPPAWLENLELRQELVDTANRFYRQFFGEDQI